MLTGTKLNEETKEISTFWSQGKNSRTKEIRFLELQREGKGMEEKQNL